MYTFCEKTISDLHKDARGFRPHAAFIEGWNLSDDENKQAIWDGLLRELDRELERERRAEAKALERFETRIAEVRSLGAPDVETAIRWILQSGEYDSMDYLYGAEYFAYDFGLPFQNKYNDVLNKICKELGRWPDEEEEAA